MLFALDSVKQLEAEHTEWESQEPFASLLKDDLEIALAGGDHAIAAIVMALHAGTTTDEFTAIVNDKEGKPVAIYQQIRRRP